MLIKRDVLDRIAAGEISIAFRCWNKPTVKTGGTLKTAVGVLAIEAVEPIEMAEITDADARRAGHADRETAIRKLCLDRAGQLYRIRLRLAGPDPRIALRESVELSVDDCEELATRLGRLDSGPAGAWTDRVLRAIQALPEKPAGELAELTGFDKEWLKTNVRKLKNLGLTESLQPGYRLSPRGRAWLKPSRDRTSSKKG
ncbi:hypothetical protein Pan44_04900 [Caulifigura coniformis]|uniref:ASCH domain-containing protein n=1 Tax=Caulifigura coniformis TaxID=2527983 RepID=A0A517S8M6_9PLAN|nr:ASCH domain-containing protein [Caulifigura coniformis]QDT52478.1 hypothetical protein Pan44_04900 [Caulifigura coniformis]